MHNFFALCKPIIQIDGTWLYEKYNRILLMEVAQGDDNNIFPIAFALVQGETSGGWIFFLKNPRTRVSLQPNLYFQADMHLLKVHIIILIIIRKILLLRMPTALDILHKTSCGKSNTRVFKNKL